MQIQSTTPLSKQNLSGLGIAARADQTTADTDFSAFLSEALDETETSQDTKAADITEAGEGDAAEASEVEDSFSVFLRQSLSGFRQALEGSATEVNEEQLYATIVEQQLGKVSEEAAAFYKTETAKLMESLRREDGYVCVEDVTKAALKATVAEGLVDQESAEKLHGIAFVAAQLDENKEALYDSFGSEEDDTVAKLSMEEALRLAQETVEKIEKGEITADPRSLDAPSNSWPGQDGAAEAEGEELAGSEAAGNGESITGKQSLDGSGGFVWKPESERDGNLAIVLPSSLGGLVESVEVYREDEESGEREKVAEGVYGGEEPESGRPVFRFDEPGAEYGTDLEVVVTKSDGETVTWQIDDGSERHD